GHAQFLQLYETHLVSEPLEAALDARLAPGYAVAVPEDDASGVLRREPLRDLRRPVAEVNDPLDALPLGQLHREDPPRVLRLEVRSLHGEQLLRPCPRLPGTGQQIPELLVSSMPDDDVELALTDKLFTFPLRRLFHPGERRGEPQDLERALLHGPV